MKVLGKLSLLSIVLLASTVIALPADARKNGKRFGKQQVRIQRQAMKQRDFRPRLGRNQIMNQAQFFRPPVWYPSREGGYYDGTGQIQGNIPGHMLFQFGGSLSDGRAAPNSPNVFMNQAGHLY